ncbi:MAG: PAS domain S-box protein [Elusimicrobia bacterium]|nr:PAS domain S-box protein [Elusimicrobiota bacterium]
MKLQDEHLPGGIDYRAVLESLHAGITLIDRGYRVQAANLQQAAFFRKDPRSFVGKFCYETFEKRKAVCPHCPGKRAMATGGRCEAVTEGVREDGSRFPVRIQAFPVCGPGGKVTGFMEMVEDLSLLRHAEHELGMRNALLRAQNEASPDGILVVDPKGRMVSFNKRFLKMWGIPDRVAQSRSDKAALASVLGKLVDPDAFLRKVRRLYKRRTETSRDLIELKDGRTFERHSSPLNGEADAHYGRVWFFRDITEPRRLELSLRESEEKFRVLASSARDAIVAMDDQGRICYWNRAAARMFGYTEGEALGRPLHPMIGGGEHHAAHRKAIPRWRRTGSGAAVGKTLEFTARRKDGTEFPIELSLSSLRLGERWHGVGIARDISERKRRDAERELLLAVSGIFREEGSFKTACSRVAEELVSKLGATASMILRLSEDGAEGTPLAYRGPKLKCRSPHSPFPIPGTVPGLVLKAGRAVIEADARRRRERAFRCLRSDGTRSVVCVPVRLGRSIVATVGIRSREVRSDLRILHETLRAVGDILAAEMERRQAEESLKGSEEKFRAAFEYAKDAIFWADPSTGIIVNCNKAAELLLKKPASSIIGSHQTSLHPPSQKQRYRQHFQRHVQARLAQDDFAEVVDSTGKVVPVGISAQRFMFGGMDIQQGIFRDLSERQKAEDALRQSEQLYRALAQGIPDFVYLLDLKGRVLYSNRGLPRMPDPVGKGQRDLFPPETAKKHLKVIRRVIRAGEPSLREETVDWRGKSAVLENRLLPLKDPDGRVERLLGLSRDITERKRTEAALRESEARHRRIIESLRQEHFFYQHDTRGVFTYLSPSVTDILGYPLSRLLTHYATYLTDHPVNKEVIRRTNLSLKGVQQPPYLVEIFHRNRSKRWLRVVESPVRAPNGEVIAVEGMAQDITQRREAEEALRESEAKYRSLIETTRTGFLILDAKGRVLDANSEYVRLTGHRRLSEIKGKSVLRWTAPSARPRNASALKECIRKGFVQGLEIDYKDRSGRIIPIEINARVEGKRESMRIVSLCRDISERKRAEAELQSLRAAAAQSQETERRRLSRELHDGVGQMLSGVKFSLQSLPKDVASSPWDASQHVLRAANVLDRAISEVRRVSQNLIPSELEDLGLQPALMSLCRGFKERSGVRILARFQSVPARLDSRLSLALYRIAQEALANVERHAKARSVDLLLAARRGSIKLQVADDGRGYDPKRRQRGGADRGLGLGNISERVGALGGAMSLETGLGKGTKLSVDVPLTKTRSAHP